MKGYKASALAELKRLHQAAQRRAPEGAVPSAAPSGTARRHADAADAPTPAAAAPGAPAPRTAHRVPRRRARGKGAPTPAGDPAITAGAAAAAGTAAALTPEDRVLFRRAMQFVQPLPDHGPRARVLARTEPASILQARRQQAEGRSAAAPARRPRTEHARRGLLPFDPDADAFLQAGAGPDLLRGLRRGKWIPQATLDLHGSTQDEAHERLNRFLDSCLQHDIRCVRIIHGKGIGSRHGQAVLKVAVRRQLARLQAVQAWVQCAEKDGGAGALHALLRPALPEPPGSPR